MFFSSAGGHTGRNSFERHLRTCELAVIHVCCSEVKVSFYLQNSQVQPRIECLSLEKLSVFHEPSFVLLTPSLSESAFSRLSINEVQAIPTNFKGKRIIASNRYSAYHVYISMVTKSALCRLSFLSSVIRLLSHYMLSLSDKTRKDFCHFCTRQVT